MSIQPADIKLLASERMADTADGGGRRTSIVIPDGVPGNIMPKVSRLDGVYGRVNLRKVYAHVDTPDLDVFAGAHAVLLDAADDPKIGMVLFSTNSDFDVRTDARDRIESYVVAGPPSRMVMYGRQLAGQSAITAYQRVEEPLPEVGEVFCISNETVVPAIQQFVRITDVSHEVRIFTDSNGEYPRRVLVLKTSAVLRYQFNGLDEPQRHTRAVAAAMIRLTTVADASRYFGIRPLTGGVLQDALEVSVTSVYATIVPTATRETAISNAQISAAVMSAPTRAAVLPMTQYGDVWNGVSGASVRTWTVRLARPIQKGTLRFRFAEVNTQQYPSADVTDDVNGNLIFAPHGTGAQILAASVDHDVGTITVTVQWLSEPMSGLWVSYMPAVQVNSPAHVHEIPITLGTRGTVFVLNLNPLPAKGTAFVDYRALGKWYRLRDEGDGILTGANAAYGTGTVDPVTGAVVVTLGALPDVGSSVIVGWASPAHYAIRANATADAEAALRQRATLTETPIAPTSLTVTFTSGASPIVATTDASGVITGTGVTGTVNEATGALELVYSTKFPNPETEVTVAYNKRVPVDPGAPAGTTATFVWSGESEIETVGDLRRLVLVARLHLPGIGDLAGMDIQVELLSTISGDLIVSPQYIVQENVRWRVLSQTVGTVDLDTGEVVLTATNIEVQRASYDRVLDGYLWSQSRDVDLPFLHGEWHYTATMDNAADEEPAMPAVLTNETAPLTLDLLSTVTSTIVPDSAIFDAFGRRYYDRNGIVYHTLQNDGTGTPAGTIDYGMGRVSLLDYPANTSLALTVQALLTVYGKFTAVDSTFRTAGSPLRPASTFVQVTALDGEVLTATTDQDGDFVGESVRGRVTQEMGVAHIEWGDMVTAAGNETQPWYDPDEVVGSQVWKPREVMPGTIRYSTVVQTNLPLNADILGLDPVRLPSDGRVPIMRAGDVVLLHHTDMTELPEPTEAGESYSVGRTMLADITLVDDTGAAIPSSEYTVNLDAGTVTMAADMDLGDAVLPLRAKHRIEQLNLLSDAQLNGLLSLTTPTERAFPEGSLVSSALLFGDMFARVENVFDQVTWTNEWSDMRIGANATGEYNTIDYPIEVLNESAVTERWRIHFTGGTSFQVIGENLGVIATGSTAADCAPVNLLTEQVYFVIRADGWGGGWSVGNNLRFNTIGATAPIWMARTVEPGASLSGDSVDLQIRGDVDA